MPKFLQIPIPILKINGVPIPILETYGEPIPIIEIKLIYDKDAININ